MIPINIDLLGKVLGMTGSDHDGEALVACRRANAMLRDAGVSWRDVLALPQSKGAPFSAYTNPWAPMRRLGEVRVGREHMVRAKILLACGYAWDDWKASFLRSVMARDASLTDAQKAKLRECEAMASEWRAAA